MEYKMSKINRFDVMLEKHIKSKGFYRNVAGSLKVGEIKLYNCTEEEWFEDFLTEEDGTYYMELGSVKGFGFPYRGEAPQISIGDKVHNISIEERIKFLYEALNSNENYNCLAIIYKDPDPMRGHKKSLFEIDKWIFVTDNISTFKISDL